MIDFYLENEYWFAATQLTLAMVGMGATLTVKDFKEVLLEPKAVATGLGIQLLAVPLITFLLIKLFGLSGGVAVGFAIIAAVPGGSVSNIFTHFSGGNIALSISITGITTLACLLTTPVILELLIAPYMPADFVMPAGRIAIEIGLYLLLPLMIGMLFLRFFPSYADGFSKWCVRGSLFVILLIVAGSLAAGRLDWQAFGITNVVLVAILLATLAIVARPFCKLLSLPNKDLITIEMEVVVRNINLGLLIKASLFPAVAGQVDVLGNNVLFTLLLFGGAELFLGAALIWFHRQGMKIRAGVES